LYEDPDDTGTGIVSTGIDGDLRITCPERFKQDGIVNREVGLRLLATDAPLVVSEVRFLQRQVNPALEAPAVEPDTGEDTPPEAKEDVGNIDTVLVHPDDPTKWCALEVQAVYFSGRAMSGLFKHIHAFPTDDVPFPEVTRRPDYRSSGPIDAMIAC
jgi:hypothetical protein